MFKHQANQALAADAGAAAAIVGAMRSHSKVAAVQERAAAALGNLGFKNVTTQRQVAAAGGVEAIVDALARFGDHAGVQEQGFRALRNLAALDDATIAAADEDSAKEAAGGGAGGSGGPGGGAPPAAAAMAGRFGMAAIPAALRAYAAKMRAQHQRGCVPLTQLFQQLDLALGGETSVLSESAALRAKVRSTLAALESRDMRTEF